MVDQMQATPRNSVLGLFSDIVNLPLQYMSAPQRTQQMQGAAEFLYDTGIPKTLERMSYGDSLFTGSGGLGGTTRMRPETAEALMNVAPMLPSAGRLASRAVRATEGMPVGMSIKPINLNKGIYKPELTMEEMLKVKDIPTVDRVRQSIDLVGEKEFEKMVNAQYSKYKPSDQDQEAMLVESVTLNILGKAQRSPYPQQAALDLAQQRAALPVEQGGLGLPVNNTAADRAKAMGFDVEAYHGTASKDIQKFMPEGGTPEGEKTLEWYKNRQAQNEPVGYMAFRGGSFFSPKADYAGSYAPEGTGVMYPVNLRMDNPLSLLPNAQGRYAATNASDINKTIDAMILQDSIDKSINEIAILDPAQIRSRFAAFDPFRKDVATATAMGVALPDLLAQPVNQYQNPYETLPMYTDPFGNTIGSSIR
jgi:hypothetical protein